MTFAAIALVVVGGAWLVHQLLLWMERRRWIFYLHTRATKGAAGAALLNVQQLFEPGKRTYIERAQYDERAERESGAGRSSEPATKRPEHDH